MPELKFFAAVWPYYLGGFLGAYILGSIPFGLVVGYLSGHGDIRKQGSGNIGATNVLRVTENKLLALITLVTDSGKGALAVIVAQSFYGPEIALLAALGAVIGHLFPVWLGFKGGKGVATTLGTILALAFWVGVLCCLTWLIVAFLFRYSSLAGMLSIAFAPFYAWLLPYGMAIREVFEPGFGQLLFRGDLQLVQLTAILAVLVLVKHAGNIRRLLDGSESKIGQKKSDET